MCEIWDLFTLLIPTGRSPCKAKNSWNQQKNIKKYINNKQIVKNSKYSSNFSWTFTWISSSVVHSSSVDNISFK